jgi:hypothetical protein
LQPTASSISSTTPTRRYVSSKAKDSGVVGLGSVTFELFSSMETANPTMGPDPSSCSEIGTNETWLRSGNDALTP